MSMGIVSDDELESELSRLNNSSRAEIKILPKPGRSEGDKNVPDSLRKIIGENAIEEGNKETKTLTRALSISDSSISAYKRGATSTDSYHEPNAELKSHIDNTKNIIVDKARSRLLEAINHITQDKLEATKARDLAGVAKDMSAVIKNLEPELPVAVNPNQPQFIIYAPQFRKEETFEVQQVNE